MLPKPQALSANAFLVGLPFLPPQVKPLGYAHALPADTCPETSLVYPLDGGVFERCAAQTPGRSGD